MTVLLGTSSRITLARLLAHVRDPLYRNGYALVFSSAATSVLGIFYWLLAARLYPTETIGLNSALLSAMGFLAVLAQLNLVHALNRFLPTSGQAAKRLIGWSYTISVGVAIAASLIFLVGIQWWTPALAMLRTNWMLGLSFVLGTMIYCLFALLDGVLIGLRKAIWVPVENLAFALAKLLLLALFVGIFADYGVYASWLLPMAIVLLPVNWLIFKQLLPKHLAFTQTRSKPLLVANVARYVAGDYFASLIWTATICLMPIIVLQQAGATASAYYYMASTITYTFYLISLNMSMSLITEAAANIEQLFDLSYRTLIQTAKLLVPLVLIMVAGAPLLLNLFGPDYTAEATTLLRLLALSALPSIITTLYISILRIQHRMQALILINLIMSLSILTISYLLLPQYGIVGVGVAWLVSQSVVAIVLLATELRALWLLNMNLGWLLDLLAWPRTLLWRWQRRQALAQIKQVVPQLIATLSPIPGLPVPMSWQTYKILHTVNDMTVALLGPPGEPPAAVIKLPRTASAAVSLRQQVTVADRLRTQPALQEWVHLLPTTLAVGEIAGRPYLLEARMPGVDARRLLATDIDCTALRAAISGTISHLHKQTVTKAQVDEELLHRWVDEPIATLQRLQPTLSTVAGYQQQLQRLQQELRSTLLGRTVSMSWVHGDYAPSNIFVDPKSHTVTGLIDWELAARDELPQLDLVQFFVATRVLHQRCEYGDVIRTLLTDKGWMVQEAMLLEVAQASLPGEGLRERELALLCWLRHVAANVTKSEHYAHHRWWKARNLEAVLLTLK